MIRKRDVYERALILAKITVFYNLAEGIVSVAFGVQDETLSLLGFGIDSFVEVISGAGIWHMLRRLSRHHFADPGRFERRALLKALYVFWVVEAPTNPFVLRYQMISREKSNAICIRWAMSHVPDPALRSDAEYLCEPSRAVSELLSIRQPQRSLSSHRV